jgi:putative intracellular protease/amidase
MFSSRSAALVAGLALAAGISQPTAAAAPRTDPATKKVAILIFNEVQVVDFAGPLEVLSDAGFDVFTVAATKDPVTTAAGDGIKLTPKYTFADAPQADLIVIPGGGYEAPKDSETVAWIKRETVHAEHTMSVCNGAFTLANTGLLDGLKATTTAGNITRMRRTFPAIKVVGDERVVDNGKILTTAGLSAGIDGALHMVDVMKGEGAGKSVALGMELDWDPQGHFVRGTMADRLIPNVFRNLKIGDQIDFDLKGGNDRWQTTVWYKTQLSAPELSGTVKAAYEKAYALDGPWAAGSFRASSTSPLTTDMTFDDREGHHWKGAVKVEPADGDANQVAIRIAINRVG